AFCCYFVCFGSSLQNQTIKVKLGDDVTLKCNFKGHSQVTALLWERKGHSEQYVLFYRDSKPDPEKQDPLYKDRVDLLDTAMTDGEVSITLKNVTATDNGTYECFVAEKTNRPKRSIHLNITTINVQIGHNITSEISGKYLK
uniref:Ig-like domain-containing protein n=1 Tax=Gouania willdenowi TaxID=441366 RepID=A0A8C5H3H3_GOUWI